MVFRVSNGGAAAPGPQHSQVSFSLEFSSLGKIGFFTPEIIMELDLSDSSAELCGKVSALYSLEDASKSLKAAIRDPGPVIFHENELMRLHLHRLCCGEAMTCKANSDRTTHPPQVANIDSSRS
ncbi:hypothetical protein MLD38_004296 [Melastoma candidum]|uniref:Uncharacterized protein n=1 Tax=Melastoma candidum TaxID=119954 RepID=A0ACB9S627_9MYRT|nr:hypothetical protein MLD38_004296 [Melastoma candidum]